MHRYRAPIIILILVALQISVLRTFGHSFLSPSGKFLLWVGDVRSAENSQQLTDWYSFSHIIHGFVFYALLKFLMPETPPMLRLIAATGIEVGWEIIENTPMVIKHYREQALAAGYAGDTILNSVSDTCAMIVGFTLAWRIPVIVTVGLGIGLELWVAYEIRDNLTLNVINLIHHFEFIARWQSALP